MSAGRAYIDGRYSAEDEARVPVADRGFLYGDALFETLRTYWGRPFLLDRHLDRLLAACRDLGIRPREPRAELSGVVSSLIGQVGGACYLRLAVTRGSGFGPWPREMPGHGRTVVVARPLSTYPEELYARGLRLVTSSVPRTQRSPLSGLKTANYLPSILARREASGEGADEALMLNTAGRAAELSAANVFAVSGGAVLTPSLEEGPLPGVARALVLELAGRLGIPAREERLEVEQLAGAEEAFATNSVMEICPVSEVDGKRVGGAAPGELTARLQAAYREEVARQCAPSGR